MGYRKIRQHKTTLHVNNTQEGETLEKKVYRMKNNKEPFTAEVQTNYTERNEGIKPEYNIRTDRFEIAIDAMSAVDKTHKAKREARHNPPKTEQETQKNGGTEPIQAPDIS